MSLTAALEDLERIARNPAEAAATFAGRAHSRTLEIFWRCHVPLLVFYPLAALICPYSYVFGRGPNIRVHALLPLAVVLLVLMQAALFDRVLEYSRHRTLREDGQPDHSQLAFYLHLPLSAGGLFFLIHPVLGYIMLFSAVIYSVTLSINAQCRARRLNLARVLTAYLAAAILPLAALALVALMYNIVHTISVLRGLE